VGQKEQTSRAPRQHQVSVLVASRVALDEKHQEKGARETSRATCDEHTHLVLSRSHCSTRDNTRDMQHMLVLTRHMQHMLATPTCVATHVGNTNMCCNTSCRHPIRDTRCSTRDNTQMCCNTCVATHLGNTQFATHTALHVDVTHCATCHQRTPFICSFLHHNMLK